MSRVLGLLLLCALLLPYLWLAGPTAPSSDPLQLPSPYQLLTAAQQPAATEDVLRRAARLASRPGDAHTLVNMSDFRWLDDGHPPGGCTSAGEEADLEAPLLLGLVSSAPAHLEERRFIRETWGSAAVTRGLVLRFLVGITDAETQALLDREQREHGDLVQGNFKDAYRNMTYKHVMALKWMVYHCPTARYVLKMDDDVLVNTPALLDFLRRDMSPHGARDLLLCVPVLGALVKRTFRSKWRVSYAEYADAFYPTYCSGWSVLYSPDVVLRLYREAQLPSSTFFWVDDVLVTGILAARAGLRHASWESYVLREHDVDKVVSGAQEPNFLFGPYDHTVDANRRLWNRVALHLH